MSEQVQISRGVVVTVVTLLVASLLTVGYLVGQRNAVPGPVPPTASSAVALNPPVVAATPEGLEDRIGALEERVAARQREVGQLRMPASGLPTPALTVAAVVGARRVYFDRLDAIVGASAFSGSQSFAARLLPQAMLEDDKGLQRLLARTEQASSEVETLKAPPECKAHLALVAAQLREAIALLKEVQSAQASGDTGALRDLASRTETSQDETVRLQVLDRSLRVGP